MQEVSSSMEPSMATQNKRQRLDRIDTSELNPELWQELPEELLRMVIQKLPFERVVAFRTVCKRWFSEVIPGAAPHVQASSQSALLFFDKQKTYDGGLVTKYYTRWFRVANTKGEWSSLAMEQFQQKSLPPQRSREAVELLNCGEGLLFFGFIDWARYTVRDIVACNPLTGQWKCLGLPCPLLPLLQNRLFPLRRRRMLSGLVFNSRGGSYNLVVAGEDGTGEPATLLYNSSTSTWTTGSSMIPTLRKDGFYEFGRAACCNGNLWWTVQDDKMDQKFVLSYDLLGNTWRTTEVLAINSVHCPAFNSSFHLTSYEGNIFLWHLYLPHFAIWPCEFVRNAELAPEVKSMPHFMMGRVNRFLSAYPTIFRGHGCYSVFNQGNCVYHVLRLRGMEGGPGLKILVHDMKENSYTQLSTVVPPVETSSAFHFFRPENFWSFSASLISAP